MTTYSPEASDGITTSWLPLTTTFQEPTECGQLFQVLFDQKPSFVAYDPSYGQFDRGKASCLPEVLTTWWNSTNYQARGIGPLVCPDAWNTVDSLSKGATSILYMCCPPDFHRNTGVGSNIDGQARVVQEVAIFNEQPLFEYSVGCVSSVTSGQRLTYLDTSVTSTTAFDGSGYVYAKALVGLNKASDPSETSRPGAGNNNTSSSSTSLSTGTKAGIGVGITLGVLLIIGLVITTVLLLRQKRKLKAQPAYSAIPMTFANPNDRLRYQQHSELDYIGITRPPAEAGGNVPPAEMAGMRPPVTGITSRPPFEMGQPRYLAEMGGQRPIPEMGGRTYYQMP